MALCGLPLVAARWVWLLFAAVEGLWNVWISVVVVHELSCSEASRIFLDQGSSLGSLHWQVDSYPLCHQGSSKWPIFFFLLLHSRWDLSFPTRNWTNAPDLEAWNQPLDHLGKSLTHFLLPPLRLWLSLVCKVRTHAHLSLIFKPSKVRSTFYETNAKPHKDKENWRGDDSRTGVSGIFLRPDCTCLSCWI